jgi:predicted amidophosphoribosyltransferase
VDALYGQGKHHCLSRLKPRTIHRLLAAADFDVKTRHTQPVGFEEWLAAAGDLLLGASCHGCGQPWWGLCPRCRQQIGNRRPFVTTPFPYPDGFPVTVSSSPYDRLLRRVINAHKERQALILTRFLAERLALSVQTLLVKQTYSTRVNEIILVPVPSAARAVRQRGFDATHAMARLAARRLRVRYSVTVRSALAQAREVADQAGLGAQARQQNLAGALRLRRPSRAISADAAVIVVDDLVPTGSSLTEGARVLRKAGIQVLGAATVAATLRRRPPHLGPDQLRQGVQLGGLRTP